MIIPEKAFNDLRDSVVLPAIPMEKIGFLMLGLLVGIVFPRDLLRFLLHVVGTNFPAMTITLIALLPYLLCLRIARNPPAWSLMERGFLNWRR
jgi:hypothetical protein